MTVWTNGGALPAPAFSTLSAVRAGPEKPAQAASPQSASAATKSVLRITVPPPEKANCGNPVVKLSDRAGLGNLAGVGPAYRVVYNALLMQAWLRKSRSVLKALLAIA